MQHQISSRLGLLVLNDAKRREYWGLLW
jgi:hypothetical protein